jgi:hypothetical protein
MVAASINARGVQKMHVIQRTNRDSQSGHGRTAKSLKNDSFRLGTIAR